MGCLNHNPGSDGVWASECWGTPLYAECKCSDATIFKIPGFACKNPECPQDNGFLKEIDGVRKEKERLTAAKKKKKKNRLEYLAIFLITPLWSFRNLHYCPLQYY